MAELKAVQKGVFTLADDKTIDTENITSVDLSKTILFKGGVSIGGSGDKPELTNIMVRLKDSSTIEFERHGFGVEAKISWYVVEFEEGVAVQRNVEAFNQELTKTQNLDAGTDLSQSFCLISYYMEGERFSEDDFCMARLVESGSVKQIEMSFVSGGPKGEVAWQVVEVAEDANIQHGVESLDKDENSINVNMASVDLDESFLIFSYKVHGDVEPANGAIRGFLSSGNQLTFERSTAGDVQAEISWYVIEMTDGTSVQQKHLTLAAGTTSGNTSIDEVGDGQASVHIGSLQQFGKSEFNAGDEFGQSMVTVDLDDLENVHHERGQADSAGIWTFYVINWFKENGGGIMSSVFLKGVERPLKVRGFKEGATLKDDVYWDDLNPDPYPFFGLAGDHEDRIGLHKLVDLHPPAYTNGVFVSAQVSKLGVNDHDTTVILTMGETNYPNGEVNGKVVLELSFKDAINRGLRGEDNPYGIAVHEGEVGIYTMTIGFGTPLFFGQKLEVFVRVGEADVTKLEATVVFSANGTGGGDIPGGGGGVGEMP